MIENLKRGDVVLVDFGVAERLKIDIKRTCVIIQNNEFGTKSGTTVVAEIFRPDNDDLIFRPGDVWINRDEGDFFCVICDKIHKIGKYQIIEKLFSLNTIHLDKIDRTLKKILALE